MFVDVALVDAAAGDERFNHSIDERNVAAVGDLEELVHELGAEQRATRQGRRPVTFQAVLSSWADDQNTRAGFFGEVHILGDHRLIFGEAGAEDDQ